VATAANFSDSVGQIATGVWRGPNGSKFMGVTCGALNDLLADGASAAWQSGSLYPLTPRNEDYKTPLDAIERMGRDALILRYPGENHYTSLRPRVRAKWDYWTQGIKPSLIADLAAAGFPNAQVFVPNDFGPVPAPSSYWSRFWIKLPFGSHPVTSATGFIVGTDVVGAKRIGPAGLNTADGAVYYARLRSVIKRLKPAQWVNWNIAFEISTGPSVYVNLQNFLRADDPHYEYTGFTFPVAP
jgi:hypothetical protein